MPKILNFYSFIHAQMPFQVQLASKRKPFLGILHELQRGGALPAAVADGVKAFNRVHSDNGGMLEFGACNNQNHYLAIDDSTPLNYVVTTEAALRNSENDELEDVVYTVLSGMVKRQNEFLSVWLFFSSFFSTQRTNNDKRFLLSCATIPPPCCCCCCCCRREGPRCGCMATR